MLTGVRAGLALMLLLAACGPADDKLTLVFGGDVMLDRGVRAVIEKEGVPFLFEDLAPAFSRADYTILNLECPATEIMAPIPKQFVFRAEPAWLAGLQQAGVTHLNMANNHANDQGRDGLITTATNIRDYGMTPVGVGHNQAAACEPVRIQKRGITVALFSSVTLPLESWMYLTDRPDVCRARPEELEAAIRSYKAQHPNDYVVVMLHWGIEYQPLPRISQRAHAAGLIAAGADAIIGHHPHVVQSFARIQGKPVFFSLGNLVFDNPRPETQDGMLVQLTLQKNKEPDLHIIPYHIQERRPIMMTSDMRQAFIQHVQAYGDRLPPCQNY